MAYRITRGRLLHEVDMLNDKTGRPTEYTISGETQVGHLHLDYNSTYGGYELREITSPGGSVSILYSRCKANEMLAYLSGAVNALYGSFEFPQKK